MEPKLEKSFQIGAHQVDQVFGQFWGNLLLGAVHQVKPDMRLQHLAHQAINPAPHRRQQHQLAAAIFIGRQSTLDCIQLSAHLAYALQQLQFLALVLGHRISPLDNTNPGYGINPVGV